LVKKLGNWWLKKWERNKISMSFTSASDFCDNFIANQSVLLILVKKSLWVYTTDLFWIFWIPKHLIATMKQSMFKSFLYSILILHYSNISLCLSPSFKDWLKIILNMIRKYTAMKVTWQNTKIPLFKQVNSHKYYNSAIVDRKT